jgi:hypothetical protein
MEPGSHGAGAMDDRPGRDDRPAASVADRVLDGLLAFTDPDALASQLRTAQPGTSRPTWPIPNWPGWS